MRILILGGTLFLGRALAQAALERGHTLTLFNRGHSNPGLFPEAEQLRGERDGGLGALQGRRWEVVIDTCGYIPRVVGQSAELLAKAVDHYTFISSISVYASTRDPGVDERAPVAVLADETVEEITGDTYGGLKALCEQAVEREMPGRALVIRPGLIVGPHDRSDRFTYWPWRVAQGGEVLAPGRPQRAVQFIDVRDLAEWTFRMVEGARVGIYNADGPAQPLPMSDLLEACRRASGSEARFTWVDDAFLLENEVGAWIEMPLWIPESDPEAGGFFAVSNARAQEAGLRFRPLEDTLRATLDWLAEHPADYAWKAGMQGEREAALLEAWKSRGGA